MPDVIWKPKVEEPEQQWWQPPLEAVGNVFDWIKRNVEEPTATLLSAPFTPSVKGNENLPFWQREQAEYKAWQAPTLRTGINAPKFMGGEEITLGVKGALETAPWLALGYAGKALNIAGKAGGVLGKVAQTTAIPFNMADKITNFPLESVNKLVANTKILKNLARAQKRLITSEKSGRAIEYESQLTQGEGLQGLKSAKGAFTGEYSKVELNLGEKFTSQDIDNLSNAVRDLVKAQAINTFDALPATEGLANLALNLAGDATAKLQMNQLKALQKIFGNKFAVAANELTMTKGQQVLRGIVDVANFPRSVLSSFDISGLFRQGGILMASHPIQGSQTIIPYIRSVFSGKFADDMTKVIMARPNMGAAIEHGLDITEMGVRATLTGKEEAFMSNVASRLLPFVKVSERGYVTGLNDIRSRTWEVLYPQWKKIGAVDSDFKELAKLINYASGRGDLGGVLRGASPILNSVLFSPKLIMSRLQFPTMMFSQSPFVRKEAIKQMMSFLGAGASILSLAKLGGAEISLDPRAADFGKIKVGDTRLDIWTGYIQYARFMAQLASGQRVTESGNVVSQNRAETVARFAQTKLSPVAGLINDILKGSDYMGEEMELDTRSLKTQAFNRLVPLWIQDMTDAINQSGLQGGLLALPGATGVGIVTYRNDVNKIKEKLAQEKYGMSWDDVAVKYNDKVQYELGKNSPELQAAMQKQDEKLQGTPYARWREEGQNIETTYQGTINKYAQEYTLTHDGVIFREKVANAGLIRRSAYDARDTRKEFKDIVANMNKPLSDEDKAKRNPLDVARNEYYQMMYSPDLTDQFGNYDFDEADNRRQQFVQKYGDDALKYVEEYMGIKWDSPTAFNELQAAKKVLQPMWDVATKVEKMFGVTFTNSNRGQNLITKMRQQMRKQNPNMEKYYQLFYANQD